MTQTKRPVPIPDLTDQQKHDCFGQSFSGGTLWSCPACNKDGRMTTLTRDCPTCHGVGLISEDRFRAFVGTKALLKHVTIEEMAQLADLHVDVVRKAVEGLIKRGLLVRVQ
jgi:hypothetical protein